MQFAGPGGMFDINTDVDNLRRDACGNLLMNVLRGEGEFSFEETT